VPSAANEASFGLSRSFPGANENCFCPVSAISQRFIFIGAFIGVPRFLTERRVRGA
jgi:hypothetical protein